MDTETMGLLGLGVMLGMCAYLAIRMATGSSANSDLNASFTTDRMERWPDETKQIEFVMDSHPALLVSQLSKYVKEYRSDSYLAGPEKRPLYIGQVTGHTQNSVDIDFYLTLDLVRQQERTQSKILMMQMRLDLGVDNKEITELADAMANTPEEVLLTMWRAKYGEGGVKAEDILNDVTGSALFERLANHLHVERIYDSYKHTLYFKIKTKDADS